MLFVYVDVADGVHFFVYIKFSSSYFTLLNFSVKQDSVLTQIWCWNLLLFQTFCVEIEFLNWNLLNSFKMLKWKQNVKIIETFKKNFLLKNVEKRNNKV